MRKWVVVGCVALLAGCKSATVAEAPSGGGGDGGGGGGGVIVSPGAPNFVRFSNVASPVKIAGIGKETSWSGTATQVTDVAAFGPTGDASATVTFSNEVPTRVTINGPSTVTTWDSASNSTIIDMQAPPDFHYGLVNDNGQNIAVVASPYSQDFEYQSFGAWQTGRDTRAGTIGALSVGAQTANANIPATDSAAFSGTARGVYIDANGESYTVNSDVTITADFDNRLVDFSTSESRRITSFDVTRATAPELDLNGQMSYGVGSNVLSGTVSSANGMQGTIDGRFYGPIANEMGGIFAVKRNTGPEAYTGGFGATRAVAANP